MRVRMVCKYCGSEDVAHDAWAEWDLEAQIWVLRGEPFDNAYCFDCDGECSILELAGGSGAAASLTRRTTDATSL
jgi:hypothetical protein